MRPRWSLNFGKVENGQSKRWACTHSQERFRVAKKAVRKMRSAINAVPAKGRFLFLHHANGRFLGNGASRSSRIVGEAGDTSLTFSAESFRLVAHILSGSTLTVTCCDPPTRASFWHESNWGAITDLPKSFLARRSGYVARFGLN